MSELLNSRFNFETIPDPGGSQIIFIRHGQSNYTLQGTDLTDKGVSQIQNTAELLRDHINKFDCVLVLSSPAARAVGSGQIFLESLNKADVLPRTSKPIGPLVFINPEAFESYLHFVGLTYDVRYLTDPNTVDDNNLVESRTSVERRSSRFLYHITNFLKKLSKRNSQKICILVFSHFEVGNNYLHGIYNQYPEYPLEVFPTIQNGEPVIMELTSEENSYKIMARGECKDVVFDRSSCRFSEQ